MIKEMKKFLILICVAGCLMTMGCGKQTTPFAPDRLFAEEGGKTLLVANRSGSELSRLKLEGNTLENRVALPSPVNGLTVDPATGHLWVVCEGDGVNVFELDPVDLSILSQTSTGHTPSSISYNHRTKSLWLTMRYNGELWEVDPVSREVVTKLAVGHEPAEVCPFAGDSLLLVLNNLPDSASTAYPVAARLAIVDAGGKQIVRTLALPNGSTDVKAVAIDKTSSYAYVTHLLARYQLPTNQVDRGWMSTNALSVINLRTQEVENTVLLDTPQKGAANPWGVAVTPDNRQVLVAASGVHELVCIDRAALHDRLERTRQGEKVTPSTESWEGIPNDAGFLHAIRRFIPTGGKGPRSVVVTEGGDVFVSNYFTGEIAGMDLDADEPRVMPSFGTALASSEIGKGNLYFHDASLCFQGWQSCASCHPNEARTDGMNWDLLNDGMGNPKNTKSLLLSHETPPCMITGIRKDAETAVRSGFKFILFAEVDEEVNKAVDAYLKSLSPIASPYLRNGQLSESAVRGKVSYDKHCASCHQGDYYTDQLQYAVSWTTGPDATSKMDVPALNEVWRTAPYLYDGRSYSMEEMLKVHGPQQPLTDNELSDLAEYVLSL